MSPAAFQKCGIYFLPARTSGGWDIVEHPVNAVEMSLRLNGLQLVNGDNHTAQQEQWIIPHADRQAGTGVEMPVEVESRIAPLVNDAGESYVANVEYTVDVYIPNP